MYLTVVCKGNPTLWLPCFIGTNAIDHGAIERYTDLMIRLFTMAFDSDVIESLAKPVVDIVRFPMIRNTRCDAQMVHFQLQAE